MTAASVRAQRVGTASAAASSSAERAAAARPDPLAALSLVLDRELTEVRRHRLDTEGRVPASVAPYVDPSRGMLELVFDGASGPVVLAIAPGARGDTIVPVLPAPAPEGDDGTDVGGEAPFDEVVGDALEDVDRVVGHVERPDEMRGLVLHLGGRMVMVYADLWELRVTLLP
ncbi:hypothetical protein [Actinomycetospora sp. TBRC 11914]|uniref:hypothetical protein n=1 Tax=Actinomycetospora sp. TBRC 11914 TaxID=2729387 RepID=UPI00145F5CF9|nr:hypothetical protein [Actinomycetospora sp. TBRC 11914]NMO93665.1 hypothetical protein [Actinomycetospora sp. TBRC 11914]